MKIFENDFTLSNSIGHVVNIVANKMKQELENAFEEKGYDITALQWMSLGIIYENDAITQKQLTQKSKKDKTNIARIIDKLEKKGLIERIRDDEDKRVFRLFATQKGRETRQALAEIATEIIAKSTFGIPTQEHDVCLNVLKKIYSNLE